MGVFFHYRAHDVGAVDPHHTADLSPEVQQKIAQLGLVHRAGNLYESPSTQDFWQVQGNTIKRLVGEEVDNGEEIQAAPEERPMQFIESILDELEF